MITSKPTRSWNVLAAIGAGGALGSGLRHSTGLLIPHETADFPWSTLLINALGCLVMGGFMAWHSQAEEPPHLLRPFFGIGVLGGFTTFSTYIVDIIGMARADALVLAAVYLITTLLVAIPAVALGAAAMRGVLR